MRDVVAIDGPGGVGKSTVAAALADRLGVAHVDTGAYYRAATLACLRAGVPLGEGPACARVVEQAHIDRRGGRTFLDGADVEHAIRGPEVTEHVSQVAGHPQVRRLLVPRQRAATAHGGVVEGRDAGTAVVPDAPAKVWLSADPRERAARRARQLGITDPAEIDALTADLARRDTADARQMERAHDAIVVDTSERTVTQVVEAIVERLPTGPDHVRMREGS
ncbi:(d)CMP kinase [Egibacter rhizosphaerae]|uniref:(d)CMP kinase n=1 Tax=Egibacter rhizosphaerae TaxID=1670831 RepID=UPI00197ACC54|nr:(d)CMP kinase [Egibacter rhizosphaerae]